ncbi:hypothetical protein EXIGLDRAFT_715967 [Exidia glandulosa HHB12029]|uniref:Uncharacterized protein n=1 Tax=Exidia glandulosa HHB12029 TaxID=1314781 RepID=A0A165QQL4_EXIGL|nr:hypothetical protein EXIGLDRAFT_715967 [Exidia glandulosa HHB12029]
MPLDDAQAALVQEAQNANKILKDELVQHAAKLQAELLALDELISSTEAIGDQHLLEDADERLVILVEGAKLGPQYIHPLEFDERKSPFFADAQRRQQYVNFTTPRYVIPREREELLKSVRNANMRVHASRAQERGENPFEALNNVQDPSFLDNNVEDVDWNSVAAEFNVAVYPIAPRTALECEVFFRDGLRPNINRAEWTDKESKKLEDLVKASTDDPPDWEDIAEQLGNGRVALDCMKHFHFPPPGKVKAKPQKSTLVWNTETDARLADAVKKHGTKDWQLVSMAMNGEFTSAQCEAHWRNVCTTLKRGPWTLEEDDALRRATQLYASTSTTAIPWKKIAPLIPGRTNVQLRDRWLVISGVRREAAAARRQKAQWAEEDDKKLREMMAHEWNRSNPEVDWTHIAETLGKRDRACRGRWRLLRREERRVGTFSGEAPDEEDEADDLDDDDAAVSATHDAMEVEAGPSRPTESWRRPRARNRAKSTARRSTASEEPEDTMDVDLEQRPASTSTSVAVNADPAMAAAAGTLLALGQSATKEQAQPQTLTKAKGKGKSKARRRPTLGELLSDEDDEPIADPASPSESVAQDVPTTKYKRWSSVEDARLLAAAITHKINASIQWKGVAAQFPGRSEGSCKGRYNTLIRESRRFAQPPPPDSTPDVLPGMLPTYRMEVYRAPEPVSSEAAAPTPPRRSSSRSTRHRGSMAEVPLEDPRASPSPEQE